MTNKLKNLITLTVSSLLAFLLIFCAFFAIGNTKKTQNVSAATNMNILTVSDGAKAQDGQLTFRFWINKQALSNYLELVPLTMTYYNVIVNGELRADLQWLSEGIKYTSWEYNLTTDDNVGYGYFDVIINVSEFPTDKIQVMFGYTSGGLEHIDIASDHVSYATEYYSPNRISELELQIQFLEEELARVGAESSVNFQNYRNAVEQLNKLRAEYEVLKAQLNKNEPSWWDKTSEKIEETLGCNSSLSATFIPAAVAVLGAGAVIGGKRYASKKKR